MRAGGGRPLRLILGLGFLVVLGCAGSSGNEVSVDVRTDWIPSVEFDTVVVRAGTETPQSRPATLAEDYVRGVRVAELTNLANGRQDIDVRLMNGAEMVARRTVPVQLTGDLAITVILTRDCSGISCPAGDAAATACLGGRCVDPSCTPETPENCPVDDCSQDSDCPAAAQSCLSATCIYGTCLYDDDDSCGDDLYCDVEVGCRPLPDTEPFDAGPRDMGPEEDLGTDLGPDFGPGCAGEVCGAFEYCNAMLMCEPYPGCLTDAECSGSAICRNRRCIPPDDDPDGDGTPASDDCDEGNPDRFPGNEESCDDVDEDCDDTVDEGNPGILCERAGQMGECMPGGTCGCPAERYDLDGIADNGCECAASPGGGMGGSCGSAIDLGNLADSGATRTVSGNALPAGREVWYRFQGVDNADASCDTFRVQAQLTANPGDAYRLTVLRGNCSASPSCMEFLTEYEWGVNLRSTIGGRLTGHCPCHSGSGQPPANVSTCTSYTGNYFVRVTRKAGAADACDEYTLTLSNGL